MNKIDRIKKLINILNNASKEYYLYNNSIMADRQWDQLFDELKQLENETGIILSNSPTQSVGYKVKSKLEKIKHPIPLKSLGKTKSVKDLNKFISKNKCLIMLKADGLTVELLYNKGELQQASTRGNAIEGEDITHSVQTFKNVPLHIPYKGKLRIAGEAVIKLDDFKEINRKLPEDKKYKTSRNLTSGSVRQLDSKVCSERRVNFYAFNILECDNFISDSKYELFNWLGELGFSTIINTILFNDDNEEKYLQEVINKMKNIANKLYIPIDGMVISYDSILYSKTLGETNHHPLHSIAYKFYDESEETVLTDVIWQTSRTGQINPIGKFTPVILDNTEVSRASLHNISIIEKLNLNIDNRVLVCKRNLIIPNIEENLDKNKDGMIHIPQHCPVCGGITEIRQNKDSKVLMCTNPNCPAKMIKRFVHYCSRDCMNIVGLSEETLEKFINKGWINEFKDIYRLHQFKDEIIHMEGFGQKSYNKIITSIEKSKQVELPNFINALGISNVGLSTAKDICKYAKYDIDSLFDFQVPDLMRIDGIGNVVAYSFCDYFIKNRKQIKELIDILYIKKSEQNKNNKVSLEDKTFVITGSLEQFKNRNELKKKIEDLGGKVSGSVSKKTNYLINNDVSSNSSKNKKSKELGIPIITENDFINMIEKVGK